MKVELLQKSFAVSYFDEEARFCWDWGILSYERQKTLRAGGLEGRVRQELCKVLTGE